LSSSCFIFKTITLTQVSYLLKIEGQNEAGGTPEKLVVFYPSIYCYVWKTTQRGRGEVMFVSRGNYKWSESMAILRTIQHETRIAVPLLPHSPFQQIYETL